MTALAIFAAVSMSGCQSGTLPPDEGVIKWKDTEKPPIETVNSASVTQQVSKVKQAALAFGGWAPVEDGIPRYYPVADTYAQYNAGSKGTETVIAYKSTSNATDSTLRIAYIRFDLSALAETSVGGAYLELTNTMLQDSIKNYAAVYAVSDNNWTEAGLTWANKPTLGTTVLDKKEVGSQGQKIILDLTSHVNSRLAANQKIFSIGIKDPDNKAARTEFSSREGGSPPALILVWPDGNGHIEVPSTETRVTIPPRIAGEYTTMVDLIRSGNPWNTKPNADNPAGSMKSYTATKTRTLENLSGGFIPTLQKPSLSKYGGDLSRPDTATGFFYTKKVEGNGENGRWWMVDPLGYRVLNIGMVSFAPGGTAAEKVGQQMVYGDRNEWAKKATTHIRDDLGYNGMGAWSNDPLVMQNNSFPYTRLIYFVTDYADEMGQAYQDAGHKSFVNDVMPVFDPEFELFADKRAASTMAALKDDPYLIGYFSDNELPSTDQLLSKYLDISESDTLGRYSRAVAWEFLRNRHGPGAVKANISGQDKDDFRELVYGYYAFVVSKAIKRHDPNHMYLGSRIHSTAKTSPGIWRALGRYCDAIGLNYYSVWEPDFTSLLKWEKWSGKPTIMTEWYTKGMDSGLINSSGAGWIVRTQNDRGLFYEQFVMALIESGTCVGWHWFKYKDNDPTAPASDPSNVDGNKGIINTAFQEYTALTSRMRVINYNTYRLVDHFIARNGY